MTLALRDLQAAFAAHLRGEERSELAAAVGDARRLAIHRHHVAHSLATALAATFPTVQALVGAEFFRRIAGVFVARHLPTQPVLAEYGSDFAAFLAAEEAMHGLPYLADMARLDWALNVAFYSPRHPAADLTGALPEALLSKVLTLAPGAALVRSRYPIDRIWTASQPDASDGEVNLAEGPACLLVLQTGFIRLGEGEAAFVAAIAEGCSLEAAAGAGFTAEGGFDLSACFGRLRACEAFAAVQQ
jgi:hypothetical protein